MFTYSATIGRNVGATPMSDTKWFAFQGQVIALVASFAKDWMAGTDVVEHHVGTGAWEGVTEESCKVTLLSHVSLGENAIEDLKKGLAYYAEAYDQEAVALTIGQSELISGKRELMTNYQCHANHTEDCGV